MIRIIRPNGLTSHPSKKNNPEKINIIAAVKQQRRREAETILAQAKAEAQTIVDEARKQASTIVQKAKDETHAAAIATILRAKELAMNELAEQESALARLAIQIAEKIIGEQLKSNPEMVVSVVKECVKRYAHRKQIILRIHPVDLPFITQALPNIQQLVRTEIFTPRADPTIERGGCILETELGLIDGQLSTQLSALEKVLHCE
jgi:flagellar biosynthesis/type III secretory pathway protein FliH